MMSDTHSKVIIGATVVVGTLTALVAAGIAYLYSKKIDDPIPTKWKKIGKIIDLNMFPVKSCAAVKSQSFECHTLGFHWNGLFDRCFVISRNNKEVDGIKYPKLVLIQSHIDENHLILSTPGQSDFILDLNELKKRSTDTKVQLGISQATGIDAGDEVAVWLSQYIVNKSEAFRLLFYPHTYPIRAKRKFFKKYKTVKSDDVGVYQNQTSYMLNNQASIDDLNKRLNHTVTSLHFRPNIVIDGPAPYEEDTFKWIRVGENVTLRCLKPCFRCIFVNVNPATAERHPNHEPLKTLKIYRKIIPTEGPAMGVQMALRNPGTISIGDDVFIEDESEN